MNKSKLLMLICIAGMVTCINGNSIRQKRGADEEHRRDRDHGDRDRGDRGRGDRDREDRDRGDRDQDRDSDRGNGENGSDNGQENSHTNRPELPRAIQMNVPMKDGALRLDLEQSDVINATLPVFIGTGKHTFVQLDNRDKADFAVYQDVKNRASFVMWNNTARQNVPGFGSGMRGLFDQGGETFAMEPLEFGRQSRQGMDPAPDAAEPPESITVNNFDFSIYKVNKSAMLSPIQEQVVTQETERLMDEVKYYINESQQLGHQFPRYSYEVELFLVVDYATFDKFLIASPAIDYQTRELDAIDNIRFYFAHILNGMAMRYMSVTDDNFEIRIQPVGLYIAKTPEASYWTESFLVKEAFHYTEAYKALDLFEQWINDVQADLPPFDQATLFSSNNLFSGYYNGRRRTINGLASITGICKYTRASLNYDQGQYGSIQNAAHELGHNLGAYHDGSGNECDSSDQYIMAVSPGNLNERNFDNTFEFSYCTKRTFYEYLLYLNSEDTNCLSERQNYDTYWNYDYFLHTHAGQRYTADEQCKLVYGPQSLYCGGGHLDENICEAMYCWRPSESSCHVHVEQRAADATQCGDQMWCMSGRCVFDSRAPSSERPECVYGDYLDIVDRVNNYRCSDIERVAPHLCYNDQYRVQCCDTCERISSTESPTCPFGDRLPDYCRSIEDRDCYSENVERECCQTCAARRRAAQGCDYGDRSFYTCRDAESQPRNCYNSNSTCCETCPRIATGQQGCEWGDKTSWCSGINRRECYRDDFRRNCCQTCVATGPVGCEFGDKSSYCSSRDCSSSTAQKECCQTCGTPAPPTPAPVTPAPPAGTRCTTADSSECSYRVTSGRDCYNHEDICCNACSNYKTNNPECKFGDKYTWCSGPSGYVARNKGRVCLNNVDPYVSEGCCASCAPYLANPGPVTTTPSTCRDDASWCSEIYPGQCYKSTTEDTCCATCTRLRSSKSSCRYGDRYTWCHPNYCDRHESECCGTC